MTNKEIRTLPVTISSGVRLLASQNSDIKPVVIEAKKVKGYICINAYTLDGDTVDLAFRYLWKNTECKLYNLKKGKITTGYLSNALNNALDYRYMFVCAEKELDKIKKWTDLDDCKTIANVIYRLEYTVSNHRKQQRIDKRKAEIAQLMKPVDRKSVPKTFGSTVKKSMAKMSYIWFDRKERKATCSCCGKVLNFSVLGTFKEKEESKCPECGAKGTYLSYKRMAHRYDEGMALLIQAHSYHKLVERYFHIVYDYRHSEDGRPEVRTHEVFRTIIDFDNHKSEDFEWYYYKNSGTPSWCPPQRSIFCPEGFHHKFLNGELHKAGLKTELKKAGLENRFIGKEEVEKRAGMSHYPCYIHARYYEKIALYPFMEQLAKAGLFNIVEGYYTSSYKIRWLKLDKEATTAVGILRLKDKAQYRECVKADITVDQLKTIHQYNDGGYKDRPVSRILEIAEKFKGREKEAFGLSNKELSKTIKYLDSINVEGNENLAVDYFDYLKCCKELDYNMSSEIVLYPKNFKEAHDEAATNAQAKNLEKKYAAIAKLLPEMHRRYDFELGDLFITAPDEGRDITYEGQAMNHCVARYVDDVALGKTTILFIRKKSEPKKPFVTMEVRDDRVIQVRAFANGTPDKKVQELVRQFKVAKKVA